MIKPTLFDMDNTTRAQRSKFLDDSFAKGMSVFLCRARGALGWPDKAVATPSALAIPDDLEPFTRIVMLEDARRFITAGIDDGTAIYSNTIGGKL